MPEKTLVEAFGVGSTQNATEILISKTGLAALLATNNYSYSPSANDSLDELIAAIICAGLISLSPTEREVDKLNRNVEFRYDPTINYDSPTLDGQTYNRHVVEVAFYKPIPTPTLSPSDFTN